MEVMTSTTTMKEVTRMTLTTTMEVMTSKEAMTTTTTMEVLTLATTTMKEVMTSTTAMEEVMTTTTTTMIMTTTRGILTSKMNNQEVVTVNTSPTEAQVLLLIAYTAFLAMAKVAPSFQKSAQLDAVAVALEPFSLLKVIQAEVKAEYVLDLNFLKSAQLVAKVGAVAKVSLSLSKIVQLGAMPAAQVLLNALSVSKAATVLYLGIVQPGAAAVVVYLSLIRVA